MYKLFDWKNEIKENELDEVVNVLNNNGLVIFPTETVYGIGGNAMSNEVVDRVYSAKQRPRAKAVNILVKNIDENNSNVQARLKELDAADKNKVKGGISKFELFLLSKGMDLQESVSFLRNLQELRSTTTAHRKSRSKKNGYEIFFQIGSRTQQIHERWI